MKNSPINLHFMYLKGKEIIYKIICVYHYINHSLRKTYAKLFSILVFLFGGAMLLSTGILTF